MADPGKHVEHIEEVEEHEDSDDELREDLEEYLEHAEELHEHIRADIAEISERIERDLGILQDYQEIQETLSLLISDPAEIPDEITMDEEPNLEKEVREDKARELQEKSGNTADKSKQWTASKMLGAVFTIVVLGSAAVLLISKLMKAVGGSGETENEDASIDPETRKNVSALAEQWKQMSDNEYWIRFARFLDADTKKDDPKLTIADQIVFMNATIAIGGNSGGFMWDTTSDEVDIIKKLESACCDSDHAAGAMYRKAAELTYNEAPIPRVVMARVLKLAFAGLALKLKKERPFAG